MNIVTCIAPVNIAVIKYWGKRDEDLILPLNDSISATLSTDHMCAKTTIRADPAFTENRFWLNGKEQDFNSKRLTACLAEIRKRVDPSDPLLAARLHICSTNNFPTAAGLASSAAGFACLASALARLHRLPGDVSPAARLGSGSACRSVPGGWARWHRGHAADGVDSVAARVAPAAHWPQVRILVLVVADAPKRTSSTGGMRRTVQTSELLQGRLAVVGAWVEKMGAAIAGRDFAKFGELTMRDSNQFHAVCLDTFPPCAYLNDVSMGIVDLVHCYNAFRGEIKVAYTFDAGPNACLFMLDEEVEDFLGLLEEIFPHDPNQADYYRGEKYAIRVTNLAESVQVDKKAIGLLKYIICTRVGEGPQFLEDSNEHLLDDNGLPKDLAD